MIHLMPMLLFGVLVKMTVLLLAAWATCRALCRASAAVRHLILSAALGGVLLLPLLSLALPAWNVTWKQAASVSPAASSRPTIAPEYTPQRPLSDTTLPNNSAAGYPAPYPPNVGGAEMAASNPNKSRPSVLPRTLEAAGLLVWLLGFLATLIPFVVGLHRIGLWERTARRLEEDTLRIAEAAQQQIGLRRAVRFLRAAKGITVSGPVTWGVLRPIVLLPASSRLWSEDCLRAVLLHELAHVQRGDWLMQFGASLACALFWWHPLVWWAARQARAESELACDDQVLMTGMCAPDYAQGLIEVVRSFPAGTQLPRAVVAMARPSEVEERVRAVLAPGRDRSRLSRQRFAFTLTSVFLLLLPLSVLRPIARAQAIQAQAIQTVSGTVEQAGAHRREHGFLKFVYLKDVATDTYPKRPWTLTTSRDGRSGSLYVFSDTNTGQSFRDGTQIQMAFDKLLAQGGKPRPGAETYLVPFLLSVGLPTRHVFFTPDQRRNTAALEKEKRAWNRLVQRSPLILTDADIEPRAAAFLDSQKPPTPAVTILLKEQGAKKMAAFSAAHRGEIMGIVLDDALLSAPVIREPIVDGEGEISGGFHTLAEAQALAQRLNAASGTTDLPPNGDGSSALDDTAAAHLALGLRLRQKGRLRDRILEFRRAVQLDPNDAGAYALVRHRRHKVTLIRPPVS